MWILLLLVSALGCSSQPIMETTLEYEVTTEHHQVIGLQRDLNLVTYIQNFKQVMAEYVNSQYRNLTVNEMEKVKMTLEEFLHNFATDLRETMEDKNNDVIEANDNGNDEAFAEIKRKLVIEFPEVTDKVADKIIVKLRRNLYETRNKLDGIIRGSHNAQIENSQ